MIDDRPDVWLHSDALICVRQCYYYGFYPEARLQVKPYKYFTGVGDINEPSSSKREKNEGSQKINGDGSERDYLAIDNDNTLEYLEKILCNIHSCFYQYFDKEQKVCRYIFMKIFYYIFRFKM